MRQWFPRDIRFSTLEQAEAWMKSCESGKPDWSLPVPPVICGVWSDGRREYRPNPEWKQAKYEAVFLECQGSLTSRPRSA